MKRDSYEYPEGDLMTKKLLIVCETLDNSLITPVQELAAFAASCSISSDETTVMIAGQDVSAAVPKAAAAGIDVMTVEHEALRYYNPPALAGSVIEVCRRIGASRICFSHTMQSCAAAVIVANELDCAIVTGVERAGENNGVIEFARSAYNGKMLEKTMFGSGDGFVCTVQSGSFASDPAAPNATGNIRKFDYDAVSEKFIPLGITAADESAISLNEADVIVAAGRGVGKEENLAVIYETAKLFSNSAVGASRIVCDNGWLPYGRQVGMTGKTVSPRLYMACGISGAQQHLVGMKNSQFIVAINSDPHANIFSTAHVGVADDLNLFLPVFIEKCR